MCNSDGHNSRLRALNMAFIGPTGSNVQVSGVVTTSLPAPSTSQAIVAKATSTKAGVAIVSGTGLLLHTVTAGKTFYMTSCNLDSTVSVGVVLFDALTVTGSPKFCAFDNVTYNTRNIFPTPIPFTVGVVVDVSTGTADFRWSIEGYEQ